MNHIMKGLYRDFLTFNVEFDKTGHDIFVIWKGHKSSVKKSFYDFLKDTLI